MAQWLASSRSHVLRERKRGSMSDVLYALPGMANGWFPKLSPTGRYLLYGNWDVFGVDLQDGIEHHVVPRPWQRAMCVGWWDDESFLIYTEASFELFLVHVRDWLPVFFQQGAGWNYLRCADEHWLASNPGCLLDGDDFLFKGTYPLGGEIAGEHFVAASPSLGWQVVHFLGKVEVAAYPPQSVSAVNKAGDIGFGYSGPGSLVRFETGVVEDVTITP